MADQNKVYELQQKAIDAIKEGMYNGPRGKGTIAPETQYLNELGSMGVGWQPDYIGIANSIGFRPDAPPPPRPPSNAPQPPSPSEVAKQQVKAAPPMDSPKVGHQYEESDEPGFQFNSPVQRQRSNTAQFGGSPSSPALSGLQRILY